MKQNHSFALLAAGFSAAAVLGVGLGVGSSQPPHTPPVTFQKFKFTFETSRVHEGGTDADIYVAISYKTADEAGGSLFLLPTRNSDMEKGDTNSYAVPVPPGCKIDTLEMNRIVALTVVNGMNRDKPGWHVASLDIKGYASDGHTYLLATGPVGRWLDASNGEGPALPVTLKVPFQDLGPGDAIGDTKPWKVMKPAHEAERRSGGYEE